jgi:DNA-binding FadR family transcriptional regulator
VASIESGLLQVGDKLPAEADLAPAFGVSRSVVREALGSLRALGLIRSVSGSGTFVAARKPSLLVGRYSMHELDFVRSCLEIPAAMEAARLCTPEHAKALSGCITALGQCRDAQTWSSLDVAFHLAIAKTTGNGVLVDLTEHMHDAINQLSSSLVGSNRRVQADVEHRQVYQAIAARDQRGAAEAMGGHLSSVRQIVLAMYGGDEVWFGRAGGGGGDADEL